MAYTAFTSLVATACLVEVLGQFTIDDSTYSHEWISRTAMPLKRSDMTATTVADAIYIIGGCSNDQEWTTGDYPGYACTGITGATHKYTPADDSYQAMTDAPRSRYRHAAAAVGTRIFLFGGRTIVDSIIPQVDVFDTVAGSWSTLSTEMPNASSDLSAFVHDGKIYILGGYDATYTALDQMMIFDPAEAGSAAWTQSYSLTQGRGDAAAAIAGGIAFALGGFHHSNWSYPLAHLEVFFTSNPAGGWRSRTAMKVARGDKAVAVLHDKLHVVGGETKNSQEHSVPLMDVEVYDAATDTWYDGGNIPSHRFRFVAAAHADSIYIFGGQGALMGSHGAAGSKYPVLDVVDRYKETITIGVNSAPVFASFKILLVTLGFWTLAQ
mmetsp:Transcript_7710/g.13334  ORF Transcript_7710/g.13334 Transcript_7710/m.13334 type:complete len:381 (+) Transcript_7710:70-1212(+)